MENTLPQRPSRNVHDAWALVLFAVYTLTVYSVMAMHGYANPHKISFDFLYRTSLSAAAFTAGFALFTLLAFRFIPKLVLHVSFIASIIFSFLLAVSTGSPLGMFLGLLFTGFSVYIYVYWGLKYIGFTSKILKGATSIVIRHLLPVLSMEVFVSLAFVSQLAFSLLVLLSTDIRTEYHLHVMFLFQALWFKANAMYFFMVFVSSIISIHVLNEGRPVRIFAESLRNTLYAAGSICLGGLLLAVVQVLRYMVDRSESEDRRRNMESQGMLERVLVFVLKIVLMFLEDVIRLANDWVFVYVAIYGKSYKTSLHESFEKATDPKSDVLIHALMVDKVLWFFGILGSAIYLAVVDVFVGLRLANDMGAHLEVLFPSAFVVFFFVTFLSIFSAATKAIMFVYYEKPDCISKTLPEVRASVEEMKSERK